MNDCLLIQHCTENWEGINLLKVTAARNLEYCMKHRMDFKMSVSGNDIRCGDWDKVRLIRDAMEVKLPDGERKYNFIVFLDVDTVIVDMKADLRDACTADKIGCVRHVLTNPPYAIFLDHLNVGALYLQNTEANRENVRRWLEFAPGSPIPPWWEQGILNEQGLGQQIDDRWNATGKVNPSPNPVVLGFHGQGNVRERFNLMNEALERSKIHIEGPQISRTR